MFKPHYIADDAQRDKSVAVYRNTMIIQSMRTKVLSRVPFYFTVYYGNFLKQPYIRQRTIKFMVQIRLEIIYAPLVFPECEHKPIIVKRRNRR